MPLTELWHRLRFWLQRDKLTRELEEEMRLHMEMRAERIGPSEARRRFGNTTAMQQRSRDMWGFAALDELRQDLRFALRRLAQRPGFTLSVVGVMAIGIGATTAMFSAVDAALLRPLPFRNAEQLVLLPLEIPEQAPSAEALSHGRGFEFGDAVEMTSTFTEVAAYGNGTLDLTEPDHPLHLKVGVVSANFFDMLGVQPIKGRSLHSTESQPPAPKVALLSHALWQREFGSRDISGLVISLEQQTYEVIGVMPAGFSFPQQRDLWIPMSIPTTDETFLPFKDGFSPTVVARLADGISAEAATSRMLARWQQLRPSRLVDEAGRTSKGDDYFSRTLRSEGLPTLRETMVGDRRSALLVLLGATTMLLLVACVNVTNLLLAHGARRAGEMAVRQVLGASRFRIVRQLLTESVVLSLSGALLGTLLAPLAFRLFTVVMPKSLAGVAAAHIDLRILAFATVLAIVTGIAFGLWPALGVARADNSDVIKGGGGHGSTFARGARVRRLLVGAEMALTTTLLIGAVLMLQSFRELMSRETGMRTEGVGTLQLSFPSVAENAIERRLRMEQMLQRFAAMPDISAAGFVNNLPLAGGGIMAMKLRVPGGPIVKSDSAERVFTRIIRATAGYFPAMGIRLVRGRSFTPADDANAARSAIVGERTARTYWPDRDAVGQTFFVGTRDTIPYVVIGVVSDVREMALESDPMMQLYLPAYAQPPLTVGLVVRSTLPERALLARMTAVVQSVDRMQAVYNTRMMDDVLNVSVAPRRTNTLLISVFALLALSLAAVGIYAVVSHSVANRSRELGIRSALGASGTHLMGMISQEMLWVCLAGVALGVLAAWMLGRMLQSLLYGVTAHDPATFVLVPLLLVIPVAVATIVPARRVLRINPATVMRAD